MALEEEIRALDGQRVISVWEGARTREVEAYGAYPETGRYEAFFNEFPAFRIIAKFIVESCATEEGEDLDFGNGVFIGAALMADALTEFAKDEKFMQVVESLQ